MADKRACVHCGQEFGLRGVVTHERTCKGNKFGVHISERIRPLSRQSPSLGELAEQAAEAAKNCDAAIIAYESTLAMLEKRIEEIRR